MPDAITPAILAPAGFVPLGATAYADTDRTAIAVDAAHPLPVSLRTRAGSATPLTGSTSASGSFGPFTPELGRPIQLRLSGTWTGTATVKESNDAGATKLPLTVGGLPWATFTGNANEAEVKTPMLATATYWIDVTIASGTVSYWMGQ